MRILQCKEKDIFFISFLTRPQLRFHPAYDNNIYCERTHVVTDDDNRKHEKARENSCAQRAINTVE